MLMSLMSSGRMFWCAVLCFLPVSYKMAVATVGWLYDRVARGEPWQWYTGRLVSSQYRWDVVVRLYNADYKMTGVQEE